MTATPNSELPTELKNVENGRAPAQRLSDPAKARALGWQLVDGNKARSEKNAKLKGAIDGNRPYAWGKLNAAGQLWRTNVNFGQAKASASAALVPYYDLFSGGSKYFRVETKVGQSEDERSYYSDIITEEADRILRDSDSYDFNIQAMLFDMVVFGRGFLHWSNPLSWEFEWIEQHLVYAPERSKAFTGSLPLIVLRQSFQVDQLWRKIEDEEAAAAAGWKVGAVKKAIEKCYPKDNQGNYEFEEAQRRIKENELYEGLTCPTVNVFHLLVSEFDGTVSHLIVTEGDRATKEDQSGMECEFLLESRGKYKKMREVLPAFFFETLDGSWHGANGLAKDIFQITELQNRTLCSAVDLTFMRCGITLKSRTAEAAQKMNLIQMGIFNLLPPDVEPQQSTILGDVASPVAMYELLDVTVQRNTGTYRPKMEKPSGNPRTAEEVRREFEAGATLSNSAVNRFWKQLDHFYRELFERLKKDAEFKKNLKERGVPLEVLDKILCVYANRTAGNGSAYMRREALKEMAPLVAQFPEKGRVAWLEDTLGSLLNTRAVQRYLPKQDDEMRKTNDHAWATVENVCLKQGMAVVWTETQNNVIHAQVHLAAAAQAIKAAQGMQGEDLVNVHNFAEAVGTHVAVHLGKLSGDKVRQGDYQMLIQQWQKLAEMNDQLRKVIDANAKKMEQQQPEPQPQIDPKAIAKLRETEAKLQHKEASHQQKLRQNDERHRMNLATADARTAQQLTAEQRRQELQGQDTE